MLSLKELREMSKKQLEKLKKDIENQLERLDSKKLEEARAEAAKIAAKFGVELSELAKAPARRKTTKAKSSRPKGEPKYANPANPSQTWTGRGRKPKWVQEWIEAGKPIEELEIRKKS